MSSHAIHLRSDSPALLVEFNLPPGTHARIGASPTAEISLPLAGLAQIAGVIGRTPEGQIYHAEADGANLRHIALPAALALPPYQFVVYHPVEPAEASPAKKTRLQPSKGRIPRRTVLSLSAVALAGAIIATLIATNHHAKPQANKPSDIPEVASTPEPAPVTINRNDLSPTPQKSEVIPAIAKAIPEPGPVAISPVTPTKEPPAPPAKLDLEELAQRVAPAVFRLEVKDQAGNITGTGTAFAISAAGLAVTNFHVIDGGESFIARTTQGAEFAVYSVAATDPAADLALISLKASNLPFLELGGSDSLNIGAPVAVFGAPSGLSGTLSDGILSSRRTELEIAGKPMPNGGRLLQITAPISLGSSGSPVIDHTGKVIGVAAAILTGTGNQNLNFVIPVEAVQKLRDEFVAGRTTAIRSIGPEINPKIPSAKGDPNTAFFNDPDFEELKKHSLSHNWIQCVRLGRVLVARHSHSPKAHAILGISLGALGLHEQAETEIKASLALDPESGMTWGALGDAQSSQGKTGEARESWKKGAGLSPETASIWRSMVISFMRSGNYLDAVAPLENLRKLDRPEYTRLLAGARALYRHPPELQAMLYHFDNLAESEIAAAAPTEPEKLAASLVAAFLRHGVAPNIQAELADYAPTVNPYFDQGAQERLAILKDITTYRASWPRRTLTLVAVESARRDDLNTLEATYRLRFSATDGKTTRSGILIQGIRFTLTGNRWLVSGIQTIERVVE